MSDLAYPSSLPCPASLSVVPRERRALQGSDPRAGPLRQLQTDDVSLAQVTFMLTETQAEAWQAWYETGLTFGGSWFRATWPLPQGRVPANWRMIGGPTFDLVDGKGAWQIGAQFEVRVRALPPQAQEAAAFGIGWMSPPQQSDPETASVTEEGSIDFTGSLGSITLNFTIVPYPPDEHDVVFEIASWTPVNPGEAAPVLTPSFDICEVRPSMQLLNPSAMADGVAHISCTVDGLPADGYLILTMYHNDDTGGYGGIAWEHS